MLAPSAWFAAQLLTEELGTRRGEGRLLRWYMRTAAELFFRRCAQLDAEADADSRSTGHDLPQLDLDGHADLLAYLRPSEWVLALLLTMSLPMLEQLEPLLGAAWFIAIVARVRRREESITELNQFTQKVMAKLPSYNAPEDAFRLAQCLLCPLSKWSPTVRTHL